MLVVARVFCVAYWGVLTVLLLVPDPWALLGLSRLASTASTDRGVHFLLFFILGFLIHASRWPWRLLAFLLVLVLYAVGAELLQWFFPPRSVDALDMVENVVGIALGSLASWRLIRPRPPTATRPVKGPIDNRSYGGDKCGPAGELGRLG